MKYEFLEHTADIKFRAYGKTIEEVFENSALAIKRILYNKKIKEKISKKIKIKDKNLENLIYRFLEEILFLLDSENFLISSVKNLKISKGNLTCILIGDSSKNYILNSHIKAITYNEMKFKKINNKIIVEIIVDV